MWVVCPEGRLGIVVLCSIDVVKGLGIVHCQLVELRDWKIGHKTPGLGSMKVS